MDLKSRLGVTKILTFDSFISIDIFYVSKRGLGRLFANIQNIALVPYSASPTKSSENDFNEDHEIENKQVNFKRLGSQGYVKGGPSAWIAGADQILKKK